MLQISHDQTHRKNELIRLQSETPNAAHIISRTGTALVILGTSTSATPLPQVRYQPAARNPRCCSAATPLPQVRYQPAAYNPTCRKRGTNLLLAIQPAASAVSSSHFKCAHRYHLDLSLFPADQPYPYELKERCTHGTNARVHIQRFLKT